ncbi:MAG: flavin-dependent dehydrogenase, partial [Coleofasciculus sp. C3-bin4]|nr:flavin-dependent dehydrogenase [Coleofasciculus sp. C3-bin4]
MKEILYVEIPTPDRDAVRLWLQQQWKPEVGEKIITPDGICLQFDSADIGNQKPTSAKATIPEISVFVWSVQRTTYLKAFRWANRAIAGERRILRQLKGGLRSQFPYQYPEPPAVDLSKQSIFEALASYYPQTVHFFQKMPNGEYDLN